MGDAWGWCTGTTQRNGMGREEGGGFRMGNTCIPVVFSHPYMTTGKTIVLTRQTFVSKVMSLLFNMLSGFSSKEQVS